MIQKSLFNQTIIQTNNELVAECRDLFRSHGASPQLIKKFQETITHHYENFGRSFAWRKNITPYHIVVSEIMLQQTQTHRVAEKFELFIARFPDFATLAAAPFEEVLRTWKGLGYNRRAMNLQKIAQLVTQGYSGALPSEPEVLETFPGIGKATAASICAFAYNKPTTFIETNLRTVFIYFFYPTKTDIHDKELMPLIEKTVDQSNPREWYYALMDYGVMLKKTIGNLSRQSKHHTKQSRFEGSDRQIRGMILQALLDTPGVTQNMLIKRLDKEEERVLKILKQLKSEGFIQNHKRLLMLS